MSPSGRMLEIFHLVDSIHRDVPMKSYVINRVYSGSYERVLVQSRERSKPVIGGSDRLVTSWRELGLILGTRFWHYNGFHIYLLGFNGID